MDFSPSIFTSVIDGYLPEPQSSLLNGIIFGVDLKTTKSFYQQLKIVGLLHLVVLSGSNITLIGAVVGNITAYFSKRVSILITVLTIVSFVIFVGPQAPIVRAGIMGILTYVAILTGRKNVALYSLILSAIFIGIAFPKWLTSISMQLSYGATLGLILFGRRDIRNPVLGELRTSLAAQIFTTPLIFMCFKQISFISPIANILVAPIISPLMIFGFLTAFLGKINYLAGLLPAYVCYGLLTYMVWVIELLSRLPFAFYQLGN